MRLVLTVAGQTWPAEVVEVDAGEGRYRVRLGETEIPVDLRVVEPGAYSLLLGHASHVADVEEEAGFLVVTVGGETYRVQVDAAGRPSARRSAADGRGAGERLVAPMPGKVVAVPVAVGEAVQPGTPLCVLEAMKMENEFRATAAGVVAEVRVAPGQTVNAGDLLVRIEPEPGTPA